MKKMQKQILLLFIIGVTISCSKDDEPRFAGLGDISGNYKLYNSSNFLMCHNSNYQTINDLEILPNGRFKRKIYSINSDNICSESEKLEGQITIKGTFDEMPFGIVDYDNSELIEQISFNKSINGVHTKAKISENDSGVQHTYWRSN